jgi:hypothetical protein
MEYLSLYDYLRKPAGEKLGLEVATEARKQGIETQTRQISNPKFTGEVLLYPKDFLELYFREPDSLRLEDLPVGHDWMGNIEDDELPF